MVSERSVILVDRVYVVILDAWRVEGWNRPPFRWRQIWLLLTLCSYSSKMAVVIGDLISARHPKAVFSVSPGIWKCVGMLRLNCILPVPDLFQ